MWLSHPPNFNSASLFLDFFPLGHYKVGPAVQRASYSYLVYSSQLENKFVSKKYSKTYGIAIKYEINLMKRQVKFILFAVCVPRNVLQVYA